MRLRNVLPLFLLATAPNVWADACAVPGEVVIEDPAGDAPFLFFADAPAATPATDFLDITGISIAAPAAAEGEDAKIIFSIQTSAQFPSPTLPPNFAVFTSFIDSRNLVRGVRMQADSMGFPQFFSYVAGANGGTPPGFDGRFVEVGSEVPAEAESNYGDDGVVTIVVKTKTLKAETGSVLGGVNGGTVAAVAVEGVGGLLAFVTDEVPAGLERGTGFFQVPDCTEKSSAVATKQGSGLLAGGLPAPLLLPLALLALIRRRGVNAA